MGRNFPTASHSALEVCHVVLFRSASHGRIPCDASGDMFLGRRMNSISSSLCHDLLSRTSWLKTESRCVIQRSVQKKSSAEDRRKTSQKRIPALLRGRRLGRCLLGASGRIRIASGSFRRGRTRYFSRGRRGGRGSWTCRRCDSFSFLLARREKRETSQYTNVFLHNWRRILL